MRPRYSLQPCASLVARMDHGGPVGLHSRDLRWRAIYKIWFDGHDYATVAEHLSSGPLEVKLKERWVRDLCGSV